jgi:glycerol kinase
MKKQIQMTYPKAYLGIDQGTSATKAVVLDSKGKVLASYREEVSSKFLAEANVTQNPEELFHSVAKLVELAIKDFECEYKIQAFGLSCQRS